MKWRETFRLIWKNIHVLRSRRHFAGWPKWRHQHTFRQQNPMMQKQIKRPTFPLTLARARLAHSLASQTQHTSPFRLLRPTTIHSILMSSNRVWASVLALICNLFVIIASLYIKDCSISLCVCVTLLLLPLLFFLLCVHNTTYGQPCKCSTLYYPTLSNQSTLQFKCISIFS